MSSKDGKRSVRGHKGKKDVSYRERKGDKKSMQVMMEKIPWELGITNCWQKQEHMFKTKNVFQVP